jgi:hypothetical protein
MPRSAIPLQVQFVNKPGSTVDSQRNCTGRKKRALRLPELQAAMDTGDVKTNSSMTLAEQARSRSFMELLVEARPRTTVAAFEGCARNPFALWRSSPRTGASLFERKPMRSRYGLSAEGMVYLALGGAAAGGLMQAIQAMVRLAGAL